MVDPFTKMQRIALAVWLVALVWCGAIVGQQLVTQLSGSLIPARVISHAVWNPPYADWPHYECHLAAHSKVYTVSNTILACADGDVDAIRADPLSRGRAQFDGDVLDNGSLLAWLVIGLSVMFVVAGYLLRVGGVRDPWRRALSALLDRFDGTARRR